MRKISQTHAVTLVCSERMRLFQKTANAELLLQTIFRYRSERRFLLHGFVVMPDHVHLLLSPVASLEQTVGIVKGGTSFALRKLYRGPIWQESYYAHRVRDAEVYLGQIEYIARNPERKRYEAYPHVHTRFSGRIHGMADYLWS